MDYCDDGNDQDGDGCNSTCQVETGWECTGATETSPDTCSDLCGDGVIGVSLGSDVYCDDGNTVDGDGCSMTCGVEDYYECSGGDESNASVCYDLCGDGVTIIMMGDEYCDDGNIMDNDGCSSMCEVETGASCMGGNTTSPDTCSEVCGDGITVGINDDLTHCDDGNLIDFDGCSSTCLIESGYQCVGGGLTTPDTCSSTDEYVDFFMDEDKAAATSITVGTVASAVMVGLSLMSGSYMVTMYSALSQSQLFLLTAKSDSYTPHYTKTYFEDVNFGIMSSEHANLYDAMDGRRLDSFHRTQGDENLATAGVFSESAFVVNFCLFFVMAVIALFHILLKLYIAGCVKKDNQSKLIDRILLKLYDIMTFSFYIRMMILTFPIIMLSSTAEIYEANIEGFKSELSFALAWIIFVGANLFVLFYVIHYFAYNNQPSLMTRELYAGLKEGKLNRSYELLSLLRKYAFIALVVF